jgi:hypothetical protein
MRKPQVSLTCILSIEASAYPRHMRSMQDCESWADIADYCDCDLSRLVVMGVEGHWYALLALHRRGRAEVVDLAKMPGTGSVPWHRILGDLLSLGIRQIDLDAREGTSYELILRHASRMGVSVMRDEAWEWDGEVMHEMRLMLPSVRFEPRAGSCRPVLPE